METQIKLLLREQSDQALIFYLDQVRKLEIILNLVLCASLLSGMGTFSGADGQISRFQFASLPNGGSTLKGKKVTKYGG